MNPRKNFLVCCLLAWLMLPVSGSLDAGENDFYFGCSLSGTTSSSGLDIYQAGQGPALSLYSNGGTGVQAWSGDGKGVDARSKNSCAVAGLSENQTGVFGETLGEKAAGVAGYADLGTGVLGYSVEGVGVFGETDGENRAAVQGEHSGKGIGVFGFAGVGGAGLAGDGGLNGVAGISHSKDGAGGRFYNDAQGYGVYAETTSPLEATRPALAGLNKGSGYGVMGQSKNGTGVAGKGLKLGVHGVATATKAKAAGVFGSASGIKGIGVEGSSNKGKAVYGHTLSGKAVVGAASKPLGWAGYFTGLNGANGVYIATDQGAIGLYVDGGSKSAVVPTSQGKRLLYAEEATEVYFTDYGSGRLTDGKAVIPVDPLFAETVNLAQPYHVFVQPYSDAQLVVSRRTSQEFEVRLHVRDTEGDRNAEFSYRLVAKRKGFEQARLEQAPDPGDAEKKMGAAAPDGHEKQALLADSEPDDLPEPTKLSLPHLSLRPWLSHGNQSKRLAGN